MRSESRIRGAMNDHNSNPITKENLEQLKQKQPNKSEDYWKGYFEGVSWTYAWVLEEK